MDLEDLIMGNLIDDDIKIVVTGICGNISPYKEWIKWLSYYSEDTKKRVNEIINKPTETLTFVEMREYEKIREELNALVLLERYLNNELANSQYKFLLGFVSNESIEDYMVSKLTEEELKSAYEKIKIYCDLPKIDLNKKIIEEQKEENYDKLSMEDSYVFHMISKINHQRNIEELDEEIRNKNELNNSIIQKSNVYSLKKNI